MGFILAEVKDYLAATLEAAEQLDSKSHVIVGILATIVTGLIGVVAFQYSPKLGFWGQHLTVNVSLIGAVIYTLANVLFLFGIWPKQYRVQGNTPENILTTQACNQDLRFLMFNEIWDYQARISQNNRTNQRKAQFVHWGLVLIFCFPVVAILMIAFTR